MGSPNRVMSHVLSCLTSFSSLSQLVCSEKHNWECEVAKTPQTVPCSSSLLSCVFAWQREKRHCSYSIWSMRPCAASMHSDFRSATIHCLVSSYNELINLNGRATALWTLLFWVLPLVLENADEWTPSKNVQPCAPDIRSICYRSLSLETVHIGVVGNHQYFGQRLLQYPCLCKPGNWTTRLQGSLSYSLYKIKY